MTKYAGAQDIYRELVEESNESWLLGLVAFAVVEEQRVEWMRHYEKSNGALPTADQVQGWYEQQPPGALLRAKGTAENALLAYSEQVSAELDTEHRKEIEKWNSGRRDQRAEAVLAAVRSKRGRRSC